MLRKTQILGVGITNETEGKILEYLLLSLEKRSEKYHIVTPNPEILVYAHSHPHYKKILNEARIALPDGVGVFLAGALMGSPLKERITGVDFMEEVCKRSGEQPLRIGLLGGRSGVAEKTAQCLKAKYSWIEVVFVGEEWPVARIAQGPATPFPPAMLALGEAALQRAARGGTPSSRVTPRSYDSSSHLPQIDILFVAFGHPKQEEWIYENLNHLPVKVAMGVGGAFDYISGRIERAPFMIRAIGLEWLFRLIREPWRWRRQLALGKFVWLVAKERLLNNKPIESDFSRG